MEILIEPAGALAGRVKRGDGKSPQGLTVVVDLGRTAVVQPPPTIRRRANPRGREAAVPHDLYPLLLAVSGSRTRSTSTGWPGVARLTLIDPLAGEGNDRRRDHRARCRRADRSRRMRRRTRIRIIKGRADRRRGVQSAGGRRLWERITTQCGDAERRFRRGGEPRKGVCLFSPTPRDSGSVPRILGYLGKRNDRRPLFSA